MSGFTTRGVPEVSGIVTMLHGAIGLGRIHPQNLNLYPADQCESDSMSVDGEQSIPGHRYIRNTQTVNIDLSGTRNRPIRNGPSAFQERNFDIPGTGHFADSLWHRESGMLIRCLTCLTLSKSILTAVRSSLLNGKRDEHEVQATCAVSGLIVPIGVLYRRAAFCEQSFDLRHCRIILAERAFREGSVAHHA